MVCDQELWKTWILKQCLNPTFSGIWSATARTTTDGHTQLVLILLFLEYGLRLGTKHMIDTAASSLNPTFSGIWSATRQVIEKESWYQGLNPTFSGIWSATC